MHQTRIFLMLLLLVGACAPKTKTEKPAPKADSTASVTKKDSAIEEKQLAEVPAKKETTLPAPKRTPEKAIQKEEVKAKPSEKVVSEPAKEIVAEPLKVAPTEPEQKIAKAPENVAAQKPIIQTPAIKETEKVVQPKTDSVAAKKPNEKPKGKPFYFKVVRKDDGKEIFGSLQLQEAIGASQFQLVKSGETVYLEEPRNKRGTYNIIALLPGYRQSSLVFGYFNPPIEKGPHDEDVITLTLDKARTGDYIDFNNVHFFKNTSIMRPVSKNELDELANLMKENLRYKIKIYGHCNGTQDRESYTLGTSTDFFAMNPKGNKKQTISSKELSLARAEIVKAYLVQQGIAEERVSTKGEGGKVPLYPEGGTLGQYNDRVEVEFVKH